MAVICFLRGGSGSALVSCIHNRFGHAGWCGSGDAGCWLRSGHVRGENRVHCRERLLFGGEARLLRSILHDGEERLRWHGELRLGRRECGVLKIFMLDAMRRHMVVWILEFGLTPKLLGYFCILLDFLSGKYPQDNHIVRAFLISFVACFQSLWID